MENHYFQPFSALENNSGIFSELMFLLQEVLNNSKMFTLKITGSILLKEVLEHRDLATVIMHFK